MDSVQQNNSDTVFQTVAPWINTKWAFVRKVITCKYSLQLVKRWAALTSTANLHFCRVIVVLAWTRNFRLARSSELIKNTEIDSENIAVICSKHTEQCTCKRSLDSNKFIMYCHIHFLPVKTSSRCSCTWTVFITNRAYCDFWGHYVAGKILLRKDFTWGIFKNQALNISYHIIR